MSGPTLELREVSKAFGAQRVLDGFSLEVRPGELCALVGESGCGKTVALKLAAGLLRPDRGEVRFDGVDLATLDERGLRHVHEQMGLLYQGGALFDSIDVAANVAFPLQEIAHLRGEEAERKVTATLRRVGLESAAHLKVSELSGGMRKRVAFARAIVLEPRLLLLDEPTAGLDPLTTAVIARVIASASRELKATVLLVTHDLATAFAIADRVALMSEGRVAALDTPDALLHSSDALVTRFTHALRERLEGP
ncbi:MAG: ATP-binding cassette domain-containing protein [Myxococcaceae bacterium]|nr:ATP-binding cassette domain-containing protein [Myxococcaceae bacterium]